MTTQTKSKITRESLPTLPQDFLLAALSNKLTVLKVLIDGIEQRVRAKFIGMDFEDSDQHPFIVETADGQTLRVGIPGLNL